MKIETIKQLDYRITLIDRRILKIIETIKNLETLSILMEKTNNINLAIADLIDEKDRLDELKEFEITTFYDSWGTK